MWLSRKNASTCAEHEPNLTGLPVAAAACVQCARSWRTPTGSSDRARPCRRHVANARTCRSNQASCRPGTTTAGIACVRLQFLVFKSLPALQRVMMPGTTGDILVQVVVARRENVETRTRLIRDDDPVRPKTARDTRGPSWLYPAVGPTCWPCTNAAAATSPSPSRAAIDVAVNAICCLPFTNPGIQVQQQAYGSPTRRARAGDRLQAPGLRLQAKPEA